MTRKRPKKGNPPKDFPKKKRKVGKRKGTPANATVVSFKSKSVVIPAQLAKSDGPTTHRKLNLQVSGSSVMKKRKKLYRVEPLHKDTPEMGISRLIRTLCGVPAT